LTALTKALYYPWQDIENPEWIRTACLYWDKIATIVSAGDFSPYKTPETRALQEAGILEPLHPSDTSAHLAAQKVREFAATEEWRRLLSRPEKRRAAYMFRERRDDFLTVTHWTAAYGHFHTDRLLDWRELKGNIAHLYLTILAGEVSRNSGWALVTDKTGVRLLAESVRLGFPLIGTVELPDGVILSAPPPFQASRYGPPDLRRPLQALVAELALSTVYIDPTTPIDRLIAFRNRYSDELLRFRGEVDRLTQALRSDLESGEYGSAQDAIRQAIVDNQGNVEAALVALERQLRVSRIESRRDWLEMALLAVVPASVAAPMLGWRAVAVGAATAAIRIAFALPKWQSRGRDIISSDPYSYLLLAKRELA